MAQPTPVQFVDEIPAPAPTTGRRGWGAAEAASLRANPGKVGIIARAPRGPAHRKETGRLNARANTINRGLTGPWVDADGRFEANVRSVDDEVRIYAKYVPAPVYHPVHNAYPPFED